MPVLQPPRLLLLPLTRAVIARRLEDEAFTLPLLGPDEPLDVTFGPEWPGDPLPVFPGMLAALVGNESEVAGSFVAVRQDTGEAVGMLGTKGPPSPDGVQEIGYGSTRRCGGSASRPRAWGRWWRTCTRRTCGS
ncbi:hypothetical protein [Deinococcus sp. RM]|uniref:hypothetical protein n=1 Tax=Deinococcus sp. RM TaxID=2316359 RepID=UPI001F1DA6D0|nr:hypothetical protein [Deinococcus sp. RM]